MCFYKKPAAFALNLTEDYGFITVAFEFSNLELNIFPLSVIVSYFSY